MPQKSTVYPPILSLASKRNISSSASSGQGALAASGTEHPVHASDDIRIENGLQILMTLEMSYIVIFEEFFRN